MVPMNPPGPERRRAVEAAVREARAAYAAARPASAAQAGAAARVLPAGSTRSVLDFEPFAFRVARAGGATLNDVDGHAYVDLLGDYTAGLLGHDPEVVREAVAGVLERGWSLGAIASDEHRLAELVCSRFPSIEQVRFTNSGTEANLMAISLARHCTGRLKVAVFDGAYHGGLLSFAAGAEGLRAPFDYVICTYNDLDSVAAAIDAHGAELACLVVEPMMGAGGCLPADPGFLAGVRRLCTEHGVMLVFDEVMTSRMSIGGAQAKLGIVPDLTTLGKYLGGGLTFGAFGGPAEVMAAFDPARGGTLAHGGTFNNNAFTMAAGAAALERLLTADALDRLFDRGEELHQRLAGAAAGYELAVTGWGSILGIHPLGAPAGGLRSPADLRTADRAVGELLFHRLLAEGYYLAPRGFIALSLAVGDGQLDEFVAAFSRVIDGLSRQAILLESLTNPSR
jgi:glutamate-1-semialdehyde 2,1-aminomutase